MVDSTTSNDVMLRFDSPTSKFAVVLEDDGRVAYAYLLEDDDIVADVWLYNVEAPPNDVDWKDRAAMPFLNPKRFCRQDRHPRLTMSSVVSCTWWEQGVVVTIDGVLMAKLERGIRPGWSRLAARRGPLAQPLELEDESS